MCILTEMVTDVRSLGCTGFDKRSFLAKLAGDTPQITLTVARDSSCLKLVMS